MSSLELSKWMALFAVHEDERQAARDLAESGDGVVIDPKRDQDDEDDGDDEPTE